MASEKDVYISRRISAPATSVSYTEDLKPYRSLRKEKREKIIQKQSIDKISEGIESENLSTLELRPKISTNDRGSRKSSPRPISTESIKKVRVEVQTDQYAVRAPPLTITKTNSNEKAPYVLDPRYLSYVEGGEVNLGYSGSSHSINRSIESIPSVGVYREQYWSCSPWRCVFFHNWTRREKVLFTIVALLALVICGLVSSIGVLSNKPDTDGSKSKFFSWKF